MAPTKKCIVLSRKRTDFSVSMYVFGRTAAKHPFMVELERTVARISKMTTQVAGGRRDPSLYKYCAQVFFLS